MSPKKYQAIIISSHCLLAQQNKARLGLLHRKQVFKSMEILEKKRPNRWIKGASCNTCGSGMWEVLWRLKESTRGTLPIQQHLGQAAASSFFTGKEEDSCCWEFTLEASTANHNLIIKALSSYGFIITNGAMKDCSFWWKSGQGSHLQSSKWEEKVLCKCWAKVATAKSFFTQEYWSASWSNGSCQRKPMPALLGIRYTP